MTQYGIKFLSKMKMFGLLKYDLKRILILISDEKDEKIDISQFKQDFSYPDHPVFIEYDKGFKNADFVIEKALMEEAMKGNIDAINKLEEYREQRRYDDKVKEIFDV